MRNLPELAKKIRSLLYKLGLVLGLFLLLYQLITSIITLSQQNLFQITPVNIGIGLLFALLFPPILMINWQVLMQGWGRKLKTIEIVEGYCLSFLPRYIPGTVWGYLSRSEWLYQKFSIPYNITNTTSILEILVSISSGFIVIGIADFAPQYSRAAGKNLFHGLAPLFVILVIMLLNQVFRRTLKIYSDQEARNKISNVLHSWLVCVLFYILQWLVLGVVSFLCLKSVTGQEVFSFPILLRLAADYFIAWFAGFVVLFVPGGIGVREYILSTLLSSSFGISYAQANLISIIMRLVLTISEVIWVVFGLWVVRFRSDNP